MSTGPTISDLALSAGGILQFAMEGESVMKPIGLEGLPSITASGALSSPDEHTEIISSIEMELKHHRGMEEELTHKLNVFEQEQRIAHVPCSLHREAHSLIVDKPNLTLNMKGQQQNSFNARAPFVSNFTIVVFAFIVSALLFLLFAAAVGEGITPVDYFTRALVIGRLLLQGHSSISDLRVSLQKPVAHRI